MVRPPRQPASLSLKGTALLVLLLVAAPSFILSCSQFRGDLAINSLGEARFSLKPDFRTVQYKKRNANGVTIILSDLDAEDIRNGRFSSGSVLIIDMFLRPKAGATPIEGTATNATFRHVIFVNDDLVGIYGGGGFVYPTSKPSADSFSGEIFNSTLQIIQKSDDFVDRLGSLEITGSVMATRKEEEVTEMAYQINTEVSRRLGQVYFVLYD